MALPAMFRMVVAVASVQAALGTPSPEDVGKLICKVASFQQLEDRATGKVCEIIAETFPKVQFEPDCQTVLEAAWDYAKAQCPQGRGAGPSPGDIEKLICKFASKKDVEDRATRAVCHAIQEKFPDMQIEGQCEAAVEAAWDKAVSMCPQGRETSPSPEEIEEMICQYASNKDIEGRATHAVCGMIQEKFPDIRFEKRCEDALEAAWDKALAMCPQGRETFIDPEDIEELFCKFASSKIIEGRATRAVCTILHAKLPDIDIEACESTAETAWEKVAAMCPGRRGEAFPSPEEMEKFICKFAEKREVEDHLTTAVCAKIQAQFPNVTFEQDCEVALETVWDQAVARCPQGQGAYPTPEDVEELICELLSKRRIGGRAIWLVCAKLVAPIPDITITPEECEATLEAAWDSLEAECPPKTASVFV